MSYTAEDDKPVEKRSFQKKRFWIIAAIVVLVGTGLILFNYYAWFNMTADGGGSITFNAVGDKRFYIDNKRVGNDTVAFTFRELFGDKNHEPLATEFDPQAIGTDWLGSRPGAKVLHLESVGGIGSALVHISGKSILARKPDGALDHIFVFLLEWTPPNQPVRRYLLPVRVRKGGINSGNFFTQGASGVTATRNPTYLRILGRPDEESKMTIKFDLSPPPLEFAEEIQTKGLWEPDEGK
jgi:hypothetical protein